MVDTKPPLTDLRVVEFAGLAPGPFAGLILADWGADVIRVDRTSSTSGFSSRIPQDVLARGKRSIAIDPKVSSGLAVLKRLISSADVLVDPFRPGVMEKLGLGPNVFLDKGGLNGRLVYARLVGFSRTSRHKALAGHDLNYLALSGVLSMLPGHAERPSFPLNLLADFAGGGLMCALGILLALYERNRSGKGQIVDNDMVSATRYISSFALINAFASTVNKTSPLPSVSDKHATISTRMQNTLDDGAPFYSVYTCSDGRWFSVACIEPKFYKIFLEAFLRALPADSKTSWIPDAAWQHRREEWLRTRRFFDSGFRMYDRDHWTKVFEDLDACAVPVLSPHEAAIVASADASPQPHPNLSRTPAKPPPTIDATAPAEKYWLCPGEHTDEILHQLGVSVEEKAQLLQDGALGALVRFSKL